MRLFVAIAVVFISVHAPDGQEVEVNVEEISTIRHPQPGSDDHFAKGTRCILVMANGKFISTVDSCIDIVHKISETNK